MKDLADLTCFGSVDSQEQNPFGDGDSVKGEVTISKDNACNFLGNFHLISLESSGTKAIVLRMSAQVWSQVFLQSKLRGFRQCM